MVENEAWICALGFFIFLHDMHQEAQATGPWHPKTGLCVLVVD